MPSRKQRRRRVKERRHEYEYVYVDEDGRELPADEVEAEEDELPARAASRNGARERPKPKAAKAKSAAKSARSGSSRPAGRQPQPPSWRRVGKRALIFGPFMFVTIALLERNAGFGTQLFITGQMMLLFVPFSYLMDRMLYRRFVRQREAAADGGPRSRS